MTTKPYTPAERRILAEAWRAGCPVFGLRLSKLRPHFSVADYNAAVRVAREALRDTTDYSAGA